MMAGTTEPGPSEDLWAQVATIQLGGAHAVAEFPCGGRGRLRNGVNAGTVRGYGGVGLNLDGPVEGSAPNCEVPDA